LLGEVFFNIFGEPAELILRVAGERTESGLMRVDSPVLVEAEDVAGDGIDAVIEIGEESRFAVVRILEIGEQATDSGANSRRDGSRPEPAGSDPRHDRASSSGVLWTYRPRPAPWSATK
jgi:hypothetical protein